MPLKFVVTNDDGINEPGLAALCNALADLGNVTVVAPAKPQSGVGHQITALTPLRVEPEGPDRFAVDGTPADCVRIALKKIIPDADWVIAGINPGANLGSDVYQSGTVAAAREAAILGYRSMAFSQYISRIGHLDWDICSHHTARLIRMLITRKLPAWHHWNVNLPHPLSMESMPDPVYCPQDPNPHLYDYREDGNHYHYKGNIHDRPRDEGKDVDVCFRGNIAISLLGV